MRLPRMDWYPWDFDDDEYVRPLSWTERGAYMILLTAMWKWAEKHDTVDVPDDDYILAAICGIPEADWPVIRHRLIDHPYAPLKRDPEAGVIYSPRLRDEYAKAVARHVSAREKGALGGRPKNLPKTSSFPGANLEDSDSLAEENPELSTSQAGKTPHRSSIKDQDITTAATTTRAHEDEPTPDAVPGSASDPVFEAAVDYVLPLFGRLQLRATEGPQIRRALACVDHDLGRFRAIVDELAQRKPRKIRSFGYFVDRFEEELEDHAARSAPGPPTGAGSATAKGGGIDHAGHPTTRRPARAGRALAGSDWSVACDPLGTLGSG